MRGLAVFLLVITACNLTLKVSNPAFTLSDPNPTSLNIPQGGSGNTQVTLTPTGGFSGTVNLSLVDRATNNPVTGITLTPSSVTLAGAPLTQTLTVSVAASVSPGTYALKIRAQSGSLTQEKNLDVTVALSLIPQLAGRVGSSYQISVNLGQTLPGVSYQGIAFSVQLPSDFTLSVSPGSLTGSCTLDLYSPLPGSWNVAFVCPATSTFQGPGQVALLTATGSSGVLTILDAKLVKSGSYQEESAVGGSLVLNP